MSQQRQRPPRQNKSVKFQSKNRDDRLPVEKYCQLSTDERRQWNALDINTKRFIIRVLCSGKDVTALMSELDLTTEDTDSVPSNEENFDTVDDSNHVQDDGGIIDRLIQEAESKHSSQKLPPPGDIRRMLSSSANKSPTKSALKSDKSTNSGTKSRDANVHELIRSDTSDSTTYRVSQMARSLPDTKISANTMRIGSNLSSP